MNEIWTVPFNPIAIKEPASKQDIRGLDYKIHWQNILKSKICRIQKCATVLHYGYGEKTHIGSRRNCDLWYCLVQKLLPGLCMFHSSFLQPSYFVIQTKALMSKFSVKGKLVFCTQLQILYEFLHKRK